MKDSMDEKTIGWLRLSFQFLDTGSLIIEKIIANKNTNYVISKKEISEKQFLEETKWSDFNTLTPALFLITHGFELLIKGLSTYLNVKIKKTHNISILVSELQKNNLNIDSTLISLINKYVGENPVSELIGNFLEANPFVNNIHVDIRYPNGKNNEDIDFSPLRFNGKSIISELKTLVNDISEIQSRTLTLVRD